MVHNFFTFLNRPRTKKIYPWYIERETERKEKLRKRRNYDQRKMNTGVLTCL